MRIEILEVAMAMYPEKILFLPDKKILLIADLHFGKINHFRKSGIAVPMQANMKNASLLIDAIDLLKPDRVIFLGDLFHSSYNQEWETVAQITHHFSACSFELVIGNHDILSLEKYGQNLLKVSHEVAIGSFILTHEPLQDVPNGMYNIAGHIHPGVRLKGGAGQSLMLPCFYFRGNQAILPAFGSFTGMAKINPQKGERVFAITKNNVIDVSSPALS
jgi:DNA ligase-associated metallophosphoesterase